ncbi:MAG TPA: fatty acid--CoA ligase family protein [Albidovulum sp.]|uniref:ANL family adenylate-forming protein n=1 Tax=Albidovulum sp. TaxID=1872424 RepID=UPI002C235420|nr:fatty acid--CoA ligase family protein [Albidovulum sp.]
MTPLSEHLNLSAILAADGRLTTREDLCRFAPLKTLAAGGRVALCFDDPHLLLRAIVALDGRVASMLLLSGALDAATVGQLTQRAGCATLLTDRAELDGIAGVAGFDRAIGEGRAAQSVQTTWLMTTSGTTGIPKIIPHSLKSLARSVYRFAPADAPTWGLLYDPTRFAGLQVTLQALIGGGRLVVADTHRPIAEQIAGLAHHGVTHLSATPTLWRRILMVPGHRNLPLKQVTLGGEIADQVTMDALRASFPAARVTHIYASTEAGVGFSVNDGRAGFPAAYLSAAPGGTKLKLVDGILWLRPASAAAPGSEVETDAEGYVRSGDMIEMRGDRLHFLGRENGVINVGGVKFFPETVEDAVKAVPGVALVQVSSKKNPITGTLVVAEIQVHDGADPAIVKQAILDACRAKLVREAVPAIVRFVDGFETNAAGKLVRKGATSG